MFRHVPYSSIAPPNNGMNLTAMQRCSHARDYVVINRPSRQVMPGVGLLRLCQKLNVMDKVKRESIGAFGVTNAKDRDPNIICAMCEKILAQYNTLTDDFTPSCQQIFAGGAVPVPNFGWLCSQDCADAYEREFNVRFQRNAEGKVEYYPEGIS